MHITQEQMAEQLDLSLSFISQIERGVTKMSLGTFIDVCDCIDCSPADLIEQSTIPSEDQSLEFYELYQKLFYYMLKAYKEHLK